MSRPDRSRPVSASRKVRNCRASIIEFYYKNDELNDPMVSEEHITAFGWATPQEIDDIMALAIRVNDFLSGLFLGVGIRLVDFKMECGRLWEGDTMRIVVADEISPRFVPAVGHQVERQARQGQVPPRHWAGSSKLIRKWRAASASCRITSSRVQVGRSSSNRKDRARLKN